MSISFLPLASGFVLGASLIIAIGAQNAFILRQGLLKSHVFFLCLICSLSDAILIVLGVAGFGSLIRSSGWLINVVTLGGAVFLLFYGVLALRRALQSNALQIADNEGPERIPAITTCLALTFLNPHVYLDTVILLGGLSVQYEGWDRMAYGLGAVIASFTWFYALGYGARLLAPLFQRPMAWRILDVLIAVVMWAIAASLVYGFFRSG